AHRLLAAIDQGREIDGRHGRFYFRHVEGAETGAAPAGGPAEPVRPMGAEQSNSSVVFGERLALKLFRKLEPGINPDLEMLRFLTAHRYPNIAPLYGWYEYEGETLAATLAIAQRFIVDGVDGWELALAEIATAPDAFLDRLAALGGATAGLHSVLATDNTDPAFSPQDPSSEFLNLLKATLDDELERVFGHLPEDPSVAPIAGLEQEVRERITLPAQGPIGGKSIRIHGDYHLGQTLYTQGDWMLLDFEGEPARPLNARRQKRSPLRDVASMLRSFSYATWAVKLQRGHAAPPDFEQRARAAFLDAYLDRVDRALLPTGETQIASLLATFELEKALYELQYELDNRPDWVPIPVAGILRLVESG
ncbi:MAG: phosphotransferase, partial [Acidobacteriota bacterium]|nr:phosphotransferase [Acidobacteriota bacterium]